MEVQKATGSLCCFPINIAAATTITTSTATSNTTPAPLESNDDRNHTFQLLDKIGKDIVHVKKAYADLNDYGTDISKQIEEASKTFKSLDDLVKRNRDRPTRGPIEAYVQEDLIELKKKVMKLKQKIPSKPKPRSTSESDPHGNHHPNDSTHSDPTNRMRHIASKILDKLPNLCKEMLARSSEFQDFKALYAGLGDKQKVGLLCFFHFPGKSDPKEVHVLLVDWRGFCGSKGKPTGNFSSSYRVCLLAGEKLKEEGMDNNVHMFNVDQKILDFEKPELFQ
ncbi:hypothetical protein RHMOL_Rhmol02G0127300 [Rhododendron molle]|uniref:Uncharacterized protein n=1 Tax=Rhododendron molle TaxID=49168 RepID=A0ACC0PQT1_RHOML|nr:hypothetical protein RHMOL_Rhmol02G0127300 [Rhododendron molle]